MQNYNEITEIVHEKAELEFAPEKKTCTPKKIAGNYYLDRLLSEKQGIPVDNNGNKKQKIKWQGKERVHTKLSRFSVKEFDMEFVFNTLIKPEIQFIDKNKGKFNHLLETVNQCQWLSPWVKDPKVMQERKKILRSLAELQQNEVYSWCEYRHNYPFFNKNVNTPVENENTSQQMMPTTQTLPTTQTVPMSQTVPATQTRPVVAMAQMAPPIMAVSYLQHVMMKREREINEQNGKINELHNKLKKLSKNLRKKDDEIVRLKKQPLTFLSRKEQPIESLFTLADKGLENAFTANDESLGLIQDSPRALNEQRFFAGKDTDESQRKNEEVIDLDDLGRGGNSPSWPFE